MHREGVRQAGWVVLTLYCVILAFFALVVGLRLGGPWAASGLIGAAALLAAAVAASAGRRLSAPLLAAFGAVMSGGTTGAIGAMASSVSDTWSNRMGLFAVGAVWFGGIPALVGAGLVIKRLRESR